MHVLVCNHVRRPVIGARFEQPPLNRAGDVICCWWRRPPLILQRKSDMSVFTASSRETLINGWQTNKKKRILCLIRSRSDMTSDVHLWCVLLIYVKL